MAKDTAEADDLTVVYLGNRDVVVIQEDPNDPAVQTRVKPRDRPKKTVTIYTAHKSLSLMEIAVQLTDPTRGVWANHSDAKAPAWIAVTGPYKDALSQILAAHWGGIEVREAEPAPEHQGAISAGAAAADVEPDEEA